MPQIRFLILSLFSAFFLLSFNAVAGAETWTDPLAGLEFVKITGGCYQMGQLETERDDLVSIKGSGGYIVHYGDELPSHEVCVDDFYLGRNEVTLAAFKAFVAATGYVSEAEKDGGCQEYRIPRYRWEAKEDISWKSPGFKQNDNEPAVCLSWNDAQAFANWLTGKSPGRKFRLATEAEWEFAARDGGKDIRYGGGNDLGEVGWNVDNSPRRTSPVGTRKPSALGINDLSGNVWEWVTDTYYRNFYETANGKNPVAPDKEGGVKVVRGGGWNSFSWNCRTANRDRVLPSHRDTNLGFRLVFTE